MKEKLIKTIRTAAHKIGIDIIRHKKTNQNSYYPPDFGENTIKICERVKPYTMTSPERIFSLVNAVNYLTKNKIDGAFVECGVWKGGSSMAMALALIDSESQNRDIYLYDTFSGMPLPCDDDISFDGEVAHKTFDETKTSIDSSDWCLSTLEEVRNNILSTGYNHNKIQFIKGKVEDTIPGNIPQKIALLRLDTDWYESTKHELTHLFPLLVNNGVLIIDDYGHWRGAQKAVDEYFSENKIQILLNRIDYTGRIAVKT